MNDIIINKKNQDSVVGVIENGHIVEKYLYNIENTSILGNIYVGIVSNIIEGMQAAFIDIGEGKKAFISYKDALPKVNVTTLKEPDEINISDYLKRGQKILVQVRKEQSEEKGARVSTHITLPGKYLVLMPKTDIITISQKISDEEEKERLKSIVKRALPNGYGAIIRTDAETMVEEDIFKDAEVLIKKWKSILKAFYENQNITKLVYSDFDIVEKTLRDIANKNTDNIYINNLDVYNKVQEISRSDIASKAKYIEVEDLFREFGLIDEVSRIENRRIWLKCGGYIVIDKAEALTAIDVNSGKYTGGEELEQTALTVNIEAAVEVMKQLRLKDIGGIIVIDFIDMRNPIHKTEVLETMKKEAKKDRSKVDIREFTQLNLVEMTRKKMYI
jgi:ribonuclease G